MAWIYNIQYTQYSAYGNYVLDCTNFEFIESMETTHHLT